MHTVRSDLHRGHPLDLCDLVNFDVNLSCRSEQNEEICYERKQQTQHQVGLEWKICLKSCTLWNICLELNSNLKYLEYLWLRLIMFWVECKFIQCNIKQQGRLSKCVSVSCVFTGLCQSLSAGKAQFHQAHLINFDCVGLRIKLSTNLCSKHFFCSWAQELVSLVVPLYLKLVLEGKAVCSVLTGVCQKLSVQQLRGGFCTAVNLCVNK